MERLLTVCRGIEYSTKSIVLVERSYAVGPIEDLTLVGQVSGRKPHFSRDTSTGPYCVLLNIRAEVPVYPVFLHYHYYTMKKELLLQCR